MKKVYSQLFLTFLLSLFSLSMRAQEPSENPILVKLATEIQLIPIYLSHFDCNHSNFDLAYCAKLEKILQFDLDHNGMTSVLAANKTREALASANFFDESLRSSDWKTLGAHYVIKTRIKNQKIDIRLFSANADISKSIDQIPLEGNLLHDCFQVHQVADLIFKTLFEKDGIASTKLLYTLKTQLGPKPNSEVWECDYDGGNHRQLTFDNAYCITPAYLPPKSGFLTGAFFFVSYKTGQPKIYFQQLNQRESAKRFTLLKGNQLMPAISRQRDKIAFISDVTGNPDLFIQPFSPEKGAIGKPYQIFSTHLATQGTPTFSPDGSQIAFVSNKDGSPRIYVMEIPESGGSFKDVKAVLISKRNKESTAPVWSPDGTKLAYCALNQGIRQIWIYDFLKREERQLTQGPGNKENPTWAPNSLHLAFNSSDAGACELYVINLNQSEAVCISSGPGEKRFPCWEPH